MLNPRVVLSMLAAVSFSLTAYPAIAQPAKAPSESISCQKLLNEVTQMLADGLAVDAGAFMKAHADQCKDSAQFQTLLSIVLLRLSDEAGAETAAMRATELAPNSAAAHFQYALTLKGLGKNESAITEFDKVVELDPGNWESWASMADLYKQMHQDDKAKQCEYKAATLAAPTLGAGNSLFRNLIQQGKLTKAEEEFTNTINTNIRNPVVLQQLANQALSFNFWNCAVNASQLVLQTFPDSQEALITKAKGEYFEHKYADCLNTLSRIFKTNPNSAEAKVLSALCLIDQGHLIEAAEILEAANAPKDNSALSILAVAKWHQARGDFKAAEASFGSIADETVLPEAQLSLSRLYIKQGKFDEASEKAVFSATSQRTLSRMLATQAEAICQAPSRDTASLEKSRRLANKALANSADEPLALLAMSKIDLASGDWQTAQDMANKVLEKVPGTSDAYLVLAQVELSLGKTPEAEKHLDKVLSLANDDPEASFLLGKLYLQDGNTKGALDSLQAALAVRADSAEICYVLAQAMEQAGDKNTSLKYYKQSLSLGLGGTDNTAATQAIKRLTSKSQE